MKSNAAWAGAQQVLVVGHAVRLAQRDRGQPVRIHVAAGLVQGAALRADAHVVDQIRQSSANGRLVSALDVRLPAAEERQQGQPVAALRASASEPGFRH